MDTWLYPQVNITVLFKVMWGVRESGVETKRLAFDTTSMTRYMEKKKQVDAMSDYSKEMIISL